MLSHLFAESFPLEALEFLLAEQNIFVRQKNKSVKQFFSPSQISGIFSAVQMHATPIKTHEFHFCFHRQRARLISPRVIKIMVYFFVFARIKHEATSIFHNKKS